MVAGVRIERAADADAVAAAEALFDGRVKAEAVERFVSDPTHHLLVALESGRAVGFVSGVEVTHPDKGTEMFLYELAVGEGARNRGIGSALVRDLAELARGRGCYGMWVLTDDGNPAALRTYVAAGGTRESLDAVLFNWEF
ncbi:MAG: aminoglycoside 3-N-acetyltransferase [Gaiellales bacterium]|nr:aminoglycoside 3-N-acetyltransferase [Gaiellales bacterium]